MPSIKKQKSKIPHVEGMRGIASLIVVFCHYSYTFYPVFVLGYFNKSSIIHTPYDKVIFSTPFNLLFAGNFAVCIFFVLSGYILSHSFFIHPQIKIIRALAIRRYFRLVIPVFCSVFLGYIFIKFHLFFIDKTTYITGSISWVAGIFHTSASITQMFYEGTIGAFNSYIPSQYNNVLWTMYYEFIGSFMVFGILSLFGNEKIRWGVYIFLGFICWKSYFLGFILGILLSDLEVHNIFFLKDWNLLHNAIFIIALFFGSIPLILTDGTIYSNFHIVSLNSEENYNFFHTIGAFLLLFSVLNLQWIRNILSNKIMLFLGKISFSLYLTHLIIIASLTSLIFLFFIHKFTYNTAVLISFLLSFPIIIITAYLYTIYIDEKGILFSHFISNKLLQNSKQRNKSKAI